MNLLFVVLLLLSMVPDWLLLGLAVVLLWFGWRSRMQVWWTRALLVVAAALEGVVALLRFGGMSLTSYRAWVEVVDPGVEAALLGGVLLALFLAGVVLLARRHTHGQVFPWLQFVGHIFILAALAGNLHFLFLQSGERTSAASPDGSGEVMLLAYWAIVDINGHVLYRPRGRHLWTYVDGVGDILTECKRWTLTWDSDGRKVRLALFRQSERDAEVDNDFEKVGDRLLPVGRRPSL